MNNCNLTTITLDNIKKIELDIVLTIDKICRENGIKYSLCGGTLLGAIRHGGFIPWDDDIDIIMTRDNYDKFVFLCENNVFDKRYCLITAANDKKYFKLYSKFVDLKTIIVDSRDKTSKKMGLFVDVFPVDYLGDSHDEALRNLKKGKNMRAILSAKQWKKYYWNNDKSALLNFARMVTYIFAFLVPKSFILKRIEKNTIKRKTTFSGCACGSYFEKEIMPSHYFEKYEEVTFEGHKLYSIKNYDEYLKTIYGNYMELPPIENRISNHSFVAYYRET